MTGVFAFEVVDLPDGKLGVFIDEAARAPDAPASVRGVGSIGYLTVLQACREQYGKLPEVVQCHCDTGNAASQP